MHTTALCKIVIALPLVFLAACSSNESPTATNKEVTKASISQSQSPVEVVQSAITLARKNKVKQLIALQLPPTELERLRTEWETNQKHNLENATEADRKEFAEQVAKLTADDAEQQILTDLEPQLISFETETAPQMPMMIGLGKGVFISSIQEKKELNEQQKQQITKLIEAFAQWIQQVKLTDRTSIQKVVAHGVETARKLNVKTLDEFYQMSFDDMLTRSEILMSAVKHALTVYGLSLDEVLDSMQPKLIKEDGNEATVQVTCRVFDQPMVFEQHLIKQDGRWYNKAVKTVRENKAKTQDTEETS